MQKMWKIHFIGGTFTQKDYLSPSYINNTNPRYIEMDHMFFSTIVLTNYYREQKEIILKNLIDSNINMNISMFYEKQDTYKVIKDLTYHIGNVSADLKEFNDNRQDFDIAAFTYQDAKYIRREMQVNNEELYFLYVYKSSIISLRRISTSDTPSPPLISLNPILNVISAKTLH